MVALAHPLLLPFSTIVAPSGGAAHALQRQGSSVREAAAVEQCTLAVVLHFQRGALLKILYVPATSPSCLLLFCSCVYSIRFLNAA